MKLNILLLLNLFAVVGEMNAHYAQCDIQMFLFCFCKWV